MLHRSDQFPHLYWQNFLSVDPTTELTAQVLVAEVDRLFVDLPIRHVLVADAEVADGLRPGFLDRGYKEAVTLTMEWRRPHDRDPPVADLVELGAAELRPTVEAYMRGGPRDQDAQREMSLLKEELGHNGVRFLAAVADGEVAGWCEMRCSEAGGQVEDVVVLEPFRGRGLARALVCGAVQRLRAAACDPISVMAGDNDTVKDFYHRLGFDVTGRRWSFWWPGPW